MLPESILKSNSGTFTLLQTPRLRKGAIAVFFVLLIFVIYNARAFHDRLESLGPNGQAVLGLPASLHKNASEVGLVVSKTREEDVGWVATFCRDYACTPYIYTVDDDAEDGFLIPQTNRGHEASAYLTYVVEHYNDLHPYTIFIHGNEEHWHNDVGGPKTFNQLLNLRFEAVSRIGYVNLRCLSTPGCPDSLHPAIIQQTDIDYQTLVENFPQIWSEIFGLSPHTAPLQLGHHCCGQFAVTKERIHERPQQVYYRMLQWVAMTEWSDSYGIGWLMEKLWHITFGMPAVNVVVISMGGVARIERPGGNSDTYFLTV
ncbi:hypothetical protein N7451_007515 [Penicillium sp. IBT 35674x]|nr:hypothetical protein N7451_007515 [Penicillium sp. IBT 35674x]